MDNSIKTEIVKKCFLRFLKIIKKKTEKKYFLINIYYFIIRTNFRKLLKNVEEKIESNNLNKLALSLNYTQHTKKFYALIKNKSFDNKKSQFSSFKTKLKLLACKEIYQKNLKIKIFDYFKVMIKEAKIQENNLSKLLILCSQYFTSILLKRMKAVSGKKFLKFKKGIFFKMNSLRKLKVFSRKELQGLEIDRRIRRFGFKNKINSFFKKIRFIQASSLPNENLKICSLKFYFFKYIKQIHHNIKINKNKLRFLKHVKAKLFIRKVYKKINTNKEISGKISSLFFKIEKIIQRNFMNKLKIRNKFLIEKQQDSVSEFVRKLFVKKMFLILERKKTLGRKLQKFKNSQKLLIFKKYSDFLSFVKMKIKNTKAKNYYFIKLKVKALDKLKTFLSSMLEKKQKYILCLLNFRKNYVKKLFKALIINKSSRKIKKIDYQNIKDQRDKIISSTLIRLLISNVSKAISNKEEMIKKLYIQRSSRGIQTALLWFKKLRNRIKIKKLSTATNINNENNINNNRSSTLNKEAPQLNFTSCVKNMSGNLINSDKAITLAKQKENILEDINLLISLKNKKRFQPKKIEFY